MDNSSPRKPRLKRILPFGCCLLLLAIVHLFIFRDHWLGRSWFPYDFPAGYYATVAYWVSSLQSGEWPQWVPYQSMGYPLLMNPQSGFFYPPFWIFVVLRIPFTPHAAVIVQILHVLFGAIGLLLLAKELFGSLLAAECGALAFLFFGGFYTNAEHADIIRGFAWIPWLLWAGLFGEGRWKFRNVLLPVFVACFITGAYTGQVISGLFLLGIYLTAQAFPLRLLTPALRALGKQLALVGLGLLLSSAFLLTGAALASGLTRSQNIYALQRDWLNGRTLLDLIFPSNLIHPADDYSMYGMQVPAVLFLFVPLLGSWFLKRLAPIFAAAAVAVILSFQVFAPVSNVLRHLLPVLALSRFPSADYREFVYLAVLLAATGGIASVLSLRDSAWRVSALGMLIAALFGVLVLSCLQHDIPEPLIKPFLRIAKADLVALLAGAVLLAACCRWRKPAAGVVAIAPLIVVLSLPVIYNEKQFWIDLDSPKVLYQGRGLPLWIDGKLRTAKIFERHETARGARVFGDGQRILSWWGYLDGAYLTNDTGGVVPLARAKVEENPALMQFMLDGSRLLSIPCRSIPHVCDVSNPEVNIANRPSAGVPVSYGRNAVEYEVSLAARSLVIENEIAIRGWHVAIDGREERVKTVNGCLRGWVAPAGSHRVSLKYRTPLLVPGMILSLAAFAGWLALAALALWPNLRSRMFNGERERQMEPPSELESETSSLPMRCSTN